MAKFINFWNRFYYAVCCIGFFVYRYIFGTMIEWLLFRPLYMLPYTKNWLKKNGGKSFDEKIETAYNLYDITSDPFGPTVNTLFLSAPLLLLTNLLMIYCGHPFKDFIFDYCLLYIIILYSLVFCFEYFVLWKKDRYIDYFSHYHNESLKKKAAWGVGVATISIALLVATWFTFLYVLRNV